MDAYRKIAVARTGEDLKQIESDLADVYGPVPEEAKLLLELAEIRIAASKHDIKSIVASGQDLVFSFAKDPGDKANSLFANVSGRVRIVDGKPVLSQVEGTVCLRLPANYFEPATLVAVLRRMLKE
jgi:transcription-repair coupling factor (superfamily II helicase)